MTTLEALRGLVGALEKYVESGHTKDEIAAELARPDNGSPFSLGVRALAAWRSRTPLAGGDGTVERVATMVHDTPPSWVTVAWVRAALAALDSLLASPTERTVKP